MMWASMFEFWTGLNKQFCWTQWTSEQLSFQRDWIAELSDTKWWRIYKSTSNSQCTECRTRWHQHDNNGEGSFTEHNKAKHGTNMQIRESATKMSVLLAFTKPLVFSSQMHLWQEFKSLKYHKLSSGCWLQTNGYIIYHLEIIVGICLSLS